jgi:hypothetical protein
MARHNKEPRKDRYFALHHYMLNTDAWKGLRSAFGTTVSTMAG